MIAEEDFDFVCVGAGAGGVTAAITAHELGLKPLIVEKTDKLGGVSAISGGLCWVPANHLEERAGIEDSVEEGLAYMLWAGGGLGDEELACHYCERAREVVYFLEQKADVEWLIVPRPDEFHEFPGSDHSLAQGRSLKARPLAGSDLGTAHQVTRNFHDTARISGQSDHRKDGGALMGYLWKNALERGIEHWTNSPAIALITESGRVTGVRVKRGTEVVDVAARYGVLLATGGYDSNADYLGMYEPRRESATVALTSVTGDHLKLAGMLGAKVASPFRSVHSFHEPDVAIARDDDGTVLRSAPIMLREHPHCIIVNRYGERFHDETCYPAADASITEIDLRAPWRLANVPSWAVWDSQHVERYVPAGVMETPGIVSAPTLEELARLSGIDPEGLIKQVGRFNTFAALEQDPEFGRGSKAAGRARGDAADRSNPNLGTIEKAPFFSLRIVPRSMGIGRAGLVTNVFSQVINWNDEPIEGLYAAGNAVAMRELGLAYTGGNANARGMLQGFCAAENAALSVK